MFAGEISLSPPPVQEDRPRTLAEAKAWMRDRAGKAVHPMNNVSPADLETVLATLTGLDPVNWAAAWRRAGEAAWVEAEREAETKARRRAYLRSHGLFFMGRFPCPNHPDKLACAERERDAYLAAGALMTPAVQKVAIPFQGEPGEGDRVVIYYRRPSGVPRPRAVLMWGGVDAWKEQMTGASDLLLAQGIATIAVDGPGTGQSPVKGAPSAERQFVAALDWIAEQPDLHRKVGLLGRSFGGYWATKLAHLYPERIAAAVNWGGGAHYMFQRSWIARSRHPDSYLMELVETRKRMLGVETDEDYIDAFARLSLLDQDLLDRPCAPLLMVNGRNDTQCPVADIDLLVGRGSPKTVRMFEGGHMGITPRTLPIICEWLAARLAGEDAA